LLAVGAVAGGLCAVAPAATSAPPTSPASIAALVVGPFATCRFTGPRLVATHRLGARRLLSALPLLRAGCEFRTRCLGSLSTSGAIRLSGAFGAARRGIAAVLSARSPVSARIAWSVAPDIAIAVPVAAVTVAVPVAAAARSIAIVARLAMRRPVALRMGR
jgi:hypothetical protein